MPISRKKVAAKKRLENQVRESGSGQFVEQYSDSEYESSDIAYSTDSSDENSPEFKGISWTNVTGLYLSFLLKIFFENY